ncbi:MAG: transposase, partial [Thermaceae bacterium]|nr:transposase [Thermaceae bacterium]
MFGLFHLLGYQFSPPLKDLKDTRYWRIDRNIDYGNLNAVSENRIHTALIAQHWDDVLPVVGSLKLNAVNATEVMRVLAKDGSLSSLGKAIAEIGRVTKTVYLLEYISSEVYRRRIHTQLNRGEFREQLARVVYHGNRGEVREKFRPGMEDQLGALGFVVNAIAFWNSRYMQAALETIEVQGDDTMGQDVSRLSRLKFAHIRMLGRYHFELDRVPK